ncbi:hypothetical protein VaNZ11_001040, partial [Volvox africanus]
CEQNGPGHRAQNRTRAQNRDAFTYSVVTPLHLTGPLSALTSLTFLSLRACPLVLFQPQQHAATTSSWRGRRNLGRGTGTGDVPPAADVAADFQPLTWLTERMQQHPQYLVCRFYLPSPSLPHPLSSFSPQGSLSFCSFSLDALRPIVKSGRPRRW